MEQLCLKEKLKYEATRSRHSSGAKRQRVKITLLTSPGALLPKKEGRHSLLCGLQGAYL